MGNFISQFIPFTGKRNRPALEASPPNKKFNKESHKKAKPGNRENNRTKSDDTETNTTDKNEIKKQSYSKGDVGRVKSSPSIDKKTTKAELELLPALTETRPSPKSASTNEFKEVPRPAVPKITQEIKLFSTNETIKVAALTNETSINEFDSETVKSEIQVDQTHQIEKLVSSNGIKRANEDSLISQKTESKVFIAEGNQSSVESFEKSYHDIQAIADDLQSIDSKSFSAEKKVPEEIDSGEISENHARIPNIEEEKFPESEISNETKPSFDGQNVDDLKDEGPESESISEGSPEINNDLFEEKKDRENFHSKSDFSEQTPVTESVPEILAKSQSRTSYEDDLPNTDNFFREVKVGSKKGLQWRANSCYMDALLFSMFYSTTIFDELFNDPSNYSDPMANQVVNILWTDIVKRLSSARYVSASSGTDKLRTALSGINPRITGDMMDVDELISTLFKRALKLPGFIEYSIGTVTTTNHMHQILFNPKSCESTSGGYTDVQTLFEASMKFQSLKMTRVPVPALIIKMSRSGGHLVHHNGILPNLVLDVSDTIVNRDSNSSPKRMYLLAVIVLQSLHYTAFIRDGIRDSSSWYYFDSLSAKVTECQGLGEEIADCEQNIEEMDIRCLSSYLGRLVADNHVCIYFSPEAL